MLLETKTAFLRMRILVKLTRKENVNRDKDGIISCLLSNFERQHLNVNSSSCSIFFLDVFRWAMDFGFALKIHVWQNVPLIEELCRSSV
jgi:hypothetical protein